MSGTTSLKLCAPSPATPLRESRPQRILGAVKKSDALRQPAEQKRSVYFTAAFHQQTRDAVRPQFFYEPL